MASDFVRRFMDRRRADAVSFGPVTRVLLTLPVLLPVWWLANAAYCVANQIPSVSAIFLGALGAILLTRIPGYLADVWRPTHLSRKQAMRERTAANRLEQQLNEKPRRSIMDPEDPPPRRW